MLEFQNVSLIRSRKELVSGVNWVVEPNERWVVIGPNGAGKTTLLQLAAAQLHPSKGTVKVLDQELGRVDVFELRPRIGMASAILADQLPKAESVADVVISAAYGVTGRWRENYEQADFERADDIMFQLRIDDLAQRTYGTLSEGERKRVQIARAMMTDPELLLLDEPASGLDLAAREDLVDTISDICENEFAPATIMVTHHVEEIPQGASHIMLMNHGKVVAAGYLDFTLTSENLSKAFDFPLEVFKMDGRWTAHAVRGRANRAI